MADISQIKDSKTDILYNIKDAQARADLQTKQDAIESVNVTYQEDGGSPDASASFSGGTLGITFKNLKGEKGDTGTKGDKGDKGDQGDSVIVGEGDLPLANSLGDSSEKAISQKAVTDCFMNVITQTISNQDDFILPNSNIGSDGVVVYNNTNRTSRFIDISETVEISSTDILSSSSGYKGVAFYYEDGQVADVLNVSGTQTFSQSDFPANAKYIRFTYNGSSTPTVTQKTKRGINEVGVEVDALRNEVVNISTIQISDEDGFFIPNKCINADGEIVDDNRYKVSRFIDISNAMRISTTLMASYSTSPKGAAFFDESKQLVSGSIKHINGAWAWESFEFPEGAKYVVFNNLISSSPVVKITVKTTLNDKVEELEDRLEEGLSNIPDIDDTLSQTGEAADSKAAGDAIFDNQTVVLSGSDYISSYKVNANGNAESNSSYSISRIIALDDVLRITATNVYGDSTTRSYAFYDASLSKVSDGRDVGSLDMSSDNFPASAKYVRFTYATGDKSTTIYKKRSWKKAVTELDKKEITYGASDFMDGYLVHATGAIQAAPTVSNVDYEISIPIIVKDASLVKIECDRSYAFYNSSFQYIEGNTTVSGLYIAKTSLPQGACYLVVCSKNNSPFRKVSVITDAGTKREDFTSIVYDTIPGYVSNSGDLVAHISYNCVFRKPLMGAKVIMSMDASVGSTGSAFSTFIFYDGSMSVIATSNQRIITVPPNAAYFSSTCSSAQSTITISKYNSRYGDDSLNSALESLSSRHMMDNILSGKKAAFLGDSLTQGGTYFNYFKQLTGMEIAQYGSNGASFGDRNDATVQIFEEVANLTGDEDLVCVFAGTNDFGHDLQIGDYYSIDNTSGDEKSAPKDGNGNLITSTTAGGIHKVINDIREAAPDAKIVFLTPLSRIQGTGGNFNSHRKNNAGFYLQDYVTCIKDICAFYCIPVLDLSTISQIDLFDEACEDKYSYDGLHVKDPAHKEIGYLLVRFINNNIVIL